MNTSTEKLIRTGLIMLGTYFLVVAPILKKLGITASKSTSPERDPFSGNAFLAFAPKDTLLITRAGAVNFSKIIYNSFGLLGDDEAKIMGVFRQLRTQSQVAFLAKIFFETYKTDLLEYLKNGRQGWGNTYWGGLNNAEINIIKELVNKKPKYK